MLARLSLFFKTAGSLGLGGVAIAIALLVFSLIEHLSGSNIAAYILVVLSSLGFSFGAYCAWDVEHQKLIAETENNRQTRMDGEIVAADLRLKRDEYFLQLAERNEELNRTINANRPEVFATYTGSLQFDEVPVDSWNPEPSFVRYNAITVNNSGKSEVFDVQIRHAICEHFTVGFPRLPKLAVDSECKVDAHLFPNPTSTYQAGAMYMVNEPKAAGSFLFGLGEVNGKKAMIIDGGIRLKVTWRDSSGHYFCSTSEDGNFSPIGRVERPLSEEEMQDAYDDETVS